MKRKKKLMFNIEKGLIKSSSIILLYGPPGVGKSELASYSSNALFADLEEGTRFLNVNRVRIDAFDDLPKLINFVSTNNEYDTLVIDTLSAAHRLAEKLTLQQLGVKSLRQVPYGGGMVELRKNISRLLVGVDLMRKANKTLIFIAHSKIRNVKDPTQEDYDRIEFDMDEKLTNDFSGVCDGVFYLRPQIRAIDRQGDKQVVSSGKRELIMSDKGGVLAKSRFNIGTSYEFDFQEDETKRATQYKNFWQKLKGE